jgi:hypothetical protein
MRGCRKKLWGEEGKESNAEDKVVGSKRKTRSTIEEKMSIHACGALKFDSRRA